MTAAFDGEILGDLTGARKIHDVCVFREHKGDIDLSLWRGIDCANHHCAAGSAQRPLHLARDKDSLQQGRGGAKGYALAQKFSSLHSASLRSVGSRMESLPNFVLHVVIAWNE